MPDTPTHPIAIIRCLDGHILMDKVFEQSGKAVLPVSVFSTTDFLKPADEQTMPSIDRAWRWYRAYLDGDENDYVKCN